MQSWTIKKQIILGLSILILINIVVGIFTSGGISKLKAFAEHISANQLRGVYLLGEIQSNENDAYNLMLQHILATTKDETDLYNSRLGEADARVDQLVTEYAQAAEMSDHDKAALDQILADRDAVRGAWAPVRELSLELKNQDAFSLFKSQAEPALPRSSK